MSLEKKELPLTEGVWRFTSFEVSSDLHFTSFHRFGSVYFNMVLLILPRRPALFSSAVKWDCVYNAIYHYIFDFILEIMLFDSP